jgi:hypothetical protein
MQRPRHLHPAEAAEAASLRRRRLWCAVEGAAQGALELALGRLGKAVPIPDLALQALAIAALTATAASILREIRLVEIGVAAAGMRCFLGTRDILATFRGAVRVAAIVGLKTIRGRHGIGWNIVPLGTGRLRVYIGVKPPHTWITSQGSRCRDLAIVG